MKTKQIIDFNSGVTNNPTVQDNATKSHEHNGTPGQVPKQNNSGNFDDSLITDNGSSVGINANIPDPSALLDIKSTNKGILIPRMTTAERDAIPNPATSLLVYDINESLFSYNAGTPSVPFWVYLNKKTGLEFDPTTNRTTKLNGQFALHHESIEVDDVTNYTIDFDLSNSIQFKCLNASQNIDLNLTNAVPGTAYVLDFVQGNFVRDLFFLSGTFPVEWSEGTKPDFSILQENERALITLFFNGQNFVASVVFNYF